MGKLRPGKPSKKLCFGSRMSRSQWIPEGPPPRTYPGPFEHSTTIGLLLKTPNKYGYTLLNSKTPRDKDFRLVTPYAPPIGTYDVEPRKPPKQQARPFGSSASRLPPLCTWYTPAPGTYSFFKREVKVCTAFLTDRIPVPCVKIVCSPFITAFCYVCETRPIGDYWHRDSTNQDMCRPCMEKEIKELHNCASNSLASYRRKLELKQFHLLRPCSFFHDHCNTTAAIQIMPTRDLVFKLRKENYLSSYGM